MRTGKIYGGGDFILFITNTAVIRFDNELELPMLQENMFFNETPEEYGWELWK